MSLPVSLSMSLFDLLTVDSTVNSANIRLLGTVRSLEEEHAKNCAVSTALLDVRAVCTLSVRE